MIKINIKSIFIFLICTSGLFYSFKKTQKNSITVQQEQPSSYNKKSYRSSLIYKNKNLKKLSRKFIKKKKIAALGRAFHKNTNRNTYKKTSSNKKIKSIKKSKNKIKNKKSKKDISKNKTKKNRKEHSNLNKKSVSAPKKRGIHKKNTTQGFQSISYSSQIKPTPKKSSTFSNSIPNTSSNTFTPNPSPDVQSQTLDFQSVINNYLLTSDFESLEEILISLNKQEEFSEEEILNKKSTIYTLSLQHYFSDVSEEEKNLTNTFIQSKFKTHLNAQAISQTFKQIDLSLEQHQYSINIISQLLDSLTNQEDDLKALLTYTELVRPNIPSTSSTPILTNSYLTLDQAIEDKRTDLSV